MGKKIFVYVAAVALLLFTVVPLLLVLMASVIPDASILSFPPRWFTAQAHPGLLRLHLHGQASPRPTSCGGRSAA